MTDVPSSSVPGDDTAGGQGLPPEYDPDPNSIIHNVISVAELMRTASQDGRWTRVDTTPLEVALGERQARALMQRLAGESKARPKPRKRSWWQPAPPHEAAPLPDSLGLLMLRWQNGEGLSRRDMRRIARDIGAPLGKVTRLFGENPRKAVRKARRIERRMRRAARATRQTIHVISDGPAAGRR